MSRARRALVPLCAIGLALVVAACGVPVSGSPRALSKNDIPTAPAPSPSTPTTVPDEVPLVVVLIDASGSYVPAFRAASQQQDKLSTALSDLLGGPAGKEIPAGWTTAVPNTTSLLDVSPNLPAGDVPPNPVQVNLSEDFLEASGIDQVLAAGQVVLTIACYLGSATRVNFFIDGSSQPVPIGTGATPSPPRAVSASDYLNGAALNCTPPFGL